MKEKGISLFWAIVWGLLFILAIVGIWFNFAQVVSAVIAGLFFGLFTYDYIKTKHI